MRVCRRVIWVWVRGSEPMRWRRSLYGAAPAGCLTLQPAQLLLGGVEPIRVGDHAMPIADTRYRGGQHRQMCDAQVHSHHSIGGRAPTPAGVGPRGEVQFGR